jgi:hypothetical protein
VPDASAILYGASGEQLFSLPFKSPNRSGIEYLAFGVDTNFMSQKSDPNGPTWLFGLETRFSISEPMRACNPGRTSGQVECAHLGDVNRSGRSDTDGETQFNGQRKPGVSRGVTGLEVHTLVSKRYRATVAFVSSLSFHPVAIFAHGRRGSQKESPPLQGWVIFGLQVIPWENRIQFQRVTLDFRTAASYRSEGRDYHELFDAIGSSAAPSLRNPNYAEYRGDPALISVQNENSQKVFTTGLSDVQAHGMINGAASATVQVGEYVKFQIGRITVQGHYYGLPLFKGPSPRPRAMLLINGV